MSCLTYAWENFAQNFFPGFPQTPNPLALLDCVALSVVLATGCFNNGAN